MNYLETYTYNKVTHNIKMCDLKQGAVHRFYNANNDVAEFYYDNEKQDYVIYMNCFRVSEGTMISARIHLNLFIKKYNLTNHSQIK